MQLINKKCRCCGRSNFSYCGTRSITPFFCRFGLHINPIPRLRGEHIFQKAPGFRFIKSLLNKVIHKTAEIDYGACADCSFIAPWPEFSDDMLSDYYVFYCSESYKKERSKLEPWYKTIAKNHSSDEELLIRRNDLNNFVTHYLQEYLSDNQIDSISVLDYGGGSAKVAPVQDWAKVYLYDVGDNRIRQTFPANESSDDENLNNHLKTGFDYIQLLHVLEHVGNPSSTLKNALDFLKPGGLLYLEVPWEMNDFLKLKNSRDIICDEHINKFSDKSLGTMVANFDLTIMLCCEGFIDTLHLEKPNRIIRCLAKKC